MIHEHLLPEMIDYYKARASEYDQWFLRQGRYDRGAELNAAWRREIEVVEGALESCLVERPAHVLELAGGTGLWTRHLVRLADEVTVVDASGEMLDVLRGRLPEAPIRLEQADLFDWRPERTYDAVFFGFWLSHVPPERFEPFWSAVREALVPGGRVFFVDSLYNQDSTAQDHQLGSTTDVTVERRLNDGRTFRIYKLFYEPQTLRERLAELGWAFDVRRTERFFIYASGGTAR
jgi:demethylmenaquinone methyltransferase/2-methoxy-6-polyprenyl-1,4-benzoquinol methylase